MSKKEIEKFFWRSMELMPEVIKGFARYEHNYLRSGEITIPQFWVLEYLSRDGVAKMSHLAKFLSISRPAATGLIDRLLIQGLVRRKADLKDRRIVWIEISPKGVQITRSILKRRLNTCIKVFGQLKAVERRNHLLLLEQLVRVFNAPGKGSHNIR